MLGRGKYEWIIKLLQYVVHTRLHTWKQYEVNRKWINLLLLFVYFTFYLFNTIYFMIFFWLKTFPVWIMLACHNRLIFNLPLSVPYRYHYSKCMICVVYVQLCTEKEAEKWQVIYQVIQHIYIHYKKYLI